MGTRFRAALVAATALMLAGCASIAATRLAPGSSSEADVRQALGEPARVFANPDGSRQLAYAEGPEGTQTYMAYLSPDGRFARLEQVLSEDRFRHIARGTTSGAELERLIGPPWRTVRFSNLGQTAWDYVFRDSWGYVVDFSVMLDDRGIVAGTISARRDTGDGSMQ